MAHIQLNANIIIIILFFFSGDNQHSLNTEFFTINFRVIKNSKRL